MDPVDTGLATVTGATCNAHEAELGTWRCSRAQHVKKLKAGEERLTRVRFNWLFSLAGAMSAMDKQA